MLEDVSQMKQSPELGRIIGTETSRKRLLDLRVNEIYLKREIFQVITASLISHIFGMHPQNIIDIIF